MANVHTKMILYILFLLAFVLNFEESRRNFFVLHYYDYRTRAIISRGLYIFYPLSKDHV